MGQRNMRCLMQVENVSQLMTRLIKVVKIHSKGHYDSLY